MVLSIPVLDRNLASHAVTSATRIITELKGAPSGPREPRTARPSDLPI